MRKTSTPASLSEDKRAVLQEAGPIVEIMVIYIA